MLFRQLRKFSQSSLPHPWYEPEHPMLKPDLDMQSLIRYTERTRNKHEEPEQDIDYSHLESNSDTVQLHEVSQSDILAAPEYMQLYLKLYANYNPDLVIQNVAQLPRVNFDRTLQQLVEFHLNYTYDELESATQVDTRYVISRFAPPRFKRLIDKVLEKAPLCGLMVPMQQYEGYSDLTLALDREIFVFFYGEGAFFDEYERSLYRRVLLKQVSSGEWVDGRKIPFVTEPEDNFLIGMLNWPGTEDHEYSFQYKPYFREYSFDQEYFYSPSAGFIQKLIRSLWHKLFYE